MLSQKFKKLLKLMKLLGDINQLKSLNCSD